MATLRESISAFYKNILGREPDAGGLAYWQAQVESGQIQLAQVVSSFTTSAEAQAVVQPIIALYQAAFGRTPDTGGLQYWVAQMQGGLSLSDVTQAFAQSSEFASVAGTSSTQFITALYQNTLGRAPDAGGLAYWLEQAANGSSPASLLASFTASAEGQRVTSEKAQVVLTYQGVLGRSPSSAELNSALQNKGTQSSIELVNSLAGNLITNGDPAAPAPTTPVTPQPTEFTFKPQVGSAFGSSDASGVVSWGNYLIVGDDESNVVRVYEKTGGAALSEFDYGTALGLSDEMDFEAMTLVGDTLVPHRLAQQQQEGPGSTGP